MSQQVLIERFFETLINGDRAAAREIVDECLSADAPSEQIIERLFWPACELIDRMYREDQITTLAHNYATRLLRMLTDQMQLRLERREPNGRRVLMFTGPQERHDLGAQMAADLLEAGGFDLLFAGGGVARDEIIEQIGQRQPDVLLLYYSAPSDLPEIRLLIDQLHDLGTCPQLQIVVGGGVFNRADGLAEEIGADVWAKTPLELVQVMKEQPHRRMQADQRTVGRRRRQSKSNAA